MAGSAGAFAYAGGWLSPGTLTQGRIVDRFEAVNGPHPGFRRNHAKGLCLAGPLRGQWPGGAPVEGLAVRPGRGHAGHRAHRAGGRAALRGGCGHDGAQPRAAVPPSRRRRMAHRQQRHPGLPRPQPGGVLRADPRRQARPGDGQARSRGAEGLLRREPRERAGGGSHQGADDHLRLRRRHIPEPQRLPVRRGGRHANARALGPRAGAGRHAGEPGAGRPPGQERSVRGFRGCGPPGARALAPRRHPRRSGRFHGGRDASLAGRAAEPRRRQRDRHRNRSGGRWQLPRRQLRPPRPPLRHRGNRRSAAQRPLGAYAQSFTRRAGEPKAPSAVHDTPTEGAGL